MKTDTNCCYCISKCMTTYCRITTYITGARLSVRWVYFQKKYHNSQKCTHPLLEELLKFIACGCIFERLQYYELNVLIKKCNGYSHDYIALHYRMGPLILKEKVGQTTTMKPAESKMKIFHPKLQCTNMGMNVRSLILLHGQKLFQPPVPSACKFSATLNKQYVATPSVKSALRKPKPHRSKCVQNVKSQRSQHFHMRACGDCSMICKFSVQFTMKKGCVTGQGS